METGTILLLVGILYFFAQSLTLTFQFTKIPDVLILVFLGVIIGPIFELTNVDDFGRMGSVMTVIALTIILFEGGTTLRLSTMGKSLLPTLIITLTTAVVSIFVIAAVALPFVGGNYGLALLTGAMLCGTSSAVVIPIVQSLKLGEKISTVLVLESAITDVICIVLTFALVESVFKNQINFSSISVQIVKSLGYAAIIGVLGGLFWLLIWNKIRKIPSSVFTTVAFAFVLYGIAEILQISGAIATLIFGLTIANLPLFFKDRHLPIISENEGSFYKELVFLLKTFFFVFLGISIKFSNFAIITTSLLIVLFLYFLRLWITRFSLPQENITQREAVIAALMIPKGLAPAVLASLIVQKGVPHSETIQAFIFSFIIFSIILTAVLVSITNHGPVGLFYKKVLKNFSTTEENISKIPN